MEQAVKQPYTALKNKILATMIVAPAIPFLLVLAIGYYQFTSALEGDAFARMTRIATDHRRVIQMFLDERKSDLSFVADTYPYEEIILKQKLAEVFNDLRKASAAFVDLGVFDDQGTHVAYQGPYQLQGMSYRDAPWFQKVMQKGYYVSDVFLGYRKVPHFIVAVKARHKGVEWVLRATIDTLFFTDLVEKVRVGKTGEAYILNDQGVFQTERRSGGELMQKDKESLPQLSPHGQVEAFVRKSGSGEAYICATAWLNDHKWILVVRQEMGDAMHSLRTASYLGLVILLAGGSCILGLAFYLTGSIVRRMEATDQEKSQLGQQLIMASRLAEIGEMSAGFAHEINNPLQIIRAEHALVETILEEMKGRGELPPGEDLEQVLDSINQIKLQVDRCGAITQGILKFARQKEPQREDLDLIRFVPEVLAMVRKKAEVNGIDLQTDLDGPISPVSADPGQLQQVLLNLINNAFDSVAQEHGAAGGAIKVRVASEDGQALVSVADNGAGVSQENLDKIFSPFFTTKPVGKGTGLGLSVCFGIIDKMGGQIAVESRPGAGATFTIQLPFSS
jgi:two-component system NtrC family sensor kinase